MKEEQSAFLAALAACAQIGAAGFVKYPDALYYFVRGYEIIPSGEHVEVRLSGLTYCVLVITENPRGTNIPEVLAFQVSDACKSEADVWSNPESSWTLRLRRVLVPVPHWVAADWAEGKPQCDN